MMDALGFERRLGEGDVGVDVAASFPCGGRVHGVLSGRHPAVGARLAAFLRELQSTPGLLRYPGDALWLEVDVARRAVVPSLFLRPASAEAAAVLVRRATSSMGLPLSAEVAATLDRWAGEDEPAILWLGFLVARDVAAVRLCLPVSARAPRRSPPPPVARRIDAAVRYARSGFADVADSLVLSVDLADGFGPRIGVEVGFGDRTTTVPVQCWARVLGRLEELGLCTAAEREHLLAWVGTSRRADDPATWPAHLPASLAPVLPYEVVLQRGISHVKLVHDADAEPSAKAYFGVRVAWEPT